MRNLAAKKKFFSKELMFEKFSIEFCHKQIDRSMAADSK